VGDREAKLALGICRHLPKCFGRLETHIWHLQEPNDRIGRRLAVLLIHRAADVIFMLIF
jgi:hypothetical protein